MRTSIRVQGDVCEALKELRWRYRSHSLNDAIATLISKAEPEVYQDIISEDLPEDEE